MGGSKSVTIGKWYYVAYHHGLTKGLIDALLEFRGGNKTAWAGEMTASGAINVDAPELWGGEADQGGIVGTLRFMNGEATQLPNSYLVSTFGNQTVAWRGFATVAFEGGKYGAMNPYPQKPSYKIRRILAGWDNDDPWYPEVGGIVTASSETPALVETFDSGDLSAYSALEGVNSGFSIVTEDGSYALQTAQATGDAEHNVIGRPLPAIAPLFRIRTRFKVKAINADDAGAFSVRDEAGDTVVGFVSCRQSAVDALRRPSVAFRAESGAPGELIGSGPVDLDVWYLFDATYDAENARFRCSITDEATGAVWGTLDVPVSAREDVAYMAWTVDDFGTGSAGAGTTVWDDAQVIVGNPSGSMNPAHMLVFSRTQQELGREPIGNINDASAKAAADWFFANGFGLCTRRRAASESPADFEDRICKVAGCSFTRSLADGQWYIDIANGEYDLESLPILTDDDVLSFRETPTVLDNAINSVSVKYFDPAKKESICTPPLRAMGLVAAFGEIHQTYEYPEIPTGPLAMRVANRELLSSVTPTRVFELDTTRVSYAWRPNQYVRLQLPKRGIDDMVCLVGELQPGQLRSGAIKVKLSEDIYSLPATVYSEVEPGVDTRPSQVPVAITDQRAFEAPYIDVVAALSRADLAALPEETGFLVGVAADPATSRDFTMRVAPSGGSYATAANGDFCPTALVVEAAPLDGTPATAFTFTGGVRLDFVEVGAAVLWAGDAGDGSDDEWCRLDAIDVGAGTISLGRGCADTVPQPHAAGSRLYFYGEGAAADTTEYTSGETVDVKLLTNTGSQQLAEADATAMSLTFGQRQIRPYPPGHFQINGLDFPATVSGPVALTWVHRDRVLQADQLLDTSAAGVGPEAGTTYTARYYIEDVLSYTDSGIAGASSSWSPAVGGNMRVELESLRDGFVSWQTIVHEFYNEGPLPWTPENLAVAPVLWLNDDSPVTDAGSGKCSLWEDISASGWDFSQSASGARPDIISAGLNSRRTIRFDGAADYMLNNSAGALAIFRNTTAGWMIVVRKKAALDGAGTDRVLFSVNTATAGAARFLSRIGSSAAANRPELRARRLDADTVATLQASGATNTAFHMQLTTMDWAAGDATIYIDGAQDAQNLAFTSSGSTSNTSTTTMITIGGIFGGEVVSQFADVEVAEMIVGVGSLPSSTEIDKLFGYLAHRWGLAANLPSGHPYKTTPPEQ